MNDAPATTAQTGKPETHNDEISAKIQAAIDANNAAWEAKLKAAIDANDAKWEAKLKAAIDANDAKWEAKLKEKDGEITQLRHDIQSWARLVTQIRSSCSSQQEFRARLRAIGYSLNFNPTSCHSAARLSM